MEADALARRRGQGRFCRMGAMIHTIEQVDWFTDDEPRRIVW